MIEMKDLSFWIAIIMIISLAIALVYIVYYQTVEYPGVLENECKQDCERLGHNFFKVRQDGWNQNDCLCITQNGDVINLW